MVKLPIIPLPRQVVLERPQREGRRGYLEAVGHTLVQEAHHHHRVHVRGRTAGVAAARARFAARTAAGATVQNIRLIIYV